MMSDRKIYPEPSSDDLYNRDKKEAPPSEVRPDLVSRKSTLGVRQQMKTEMPSSQAYKSLHGTYQARRRLSDVKTDRRKSSVAVSKMNRKRGKVSPEPPAYEANNPNPSPARGYDPETNFYAVGAKVGAFGSYTNYFETPHWASMKLTPQPTQPTGDPNPWDRKYISRGAFNVETLMEAEKKGLKFNEGDEFDEVERLQQVEIIRQMPVSIPVKRMLRAKVMEGMTDYNGGSWRQCCNHAKANCLRCRISCGRGWDEFLVNLTLWHSAFKLINGYFGGGVLSYFKILKRLFQINFVLFLITFLFIVVPQIAFPSVDATYNENATFAVNRSYFCGDLYVDSVNTTGQDWVQYLLDLLQGTGKLERTVLFYGYYSNKELDLAYTSFNYNLPFAYIVCVLLMYLVSLITLVRYTATGFRNKILTSNSTEKQYSNKVFAGWDWGMEDPKNSVVKHKSIYREFTSTMDEERREEERSLYTTKEVCKMWWIRIGINTLVIALLVGAGWLIYFVTAQSLEIQSRSDYSTYGRARQFGVEYMVSLTITLLYAIIPIIFKKVVTFEDYNAAWEVNFTLIRTVFLRLASLAVLIFTIYTEVGCKPKDYCNVGTGTCNAYKCWETFAGQEFYKLMFTYFLTVVGVTFLWEFPRKLIVSKCDCKLSHILGLQEFDIPKNVLDLVYCQTLLWLGTLFCPLMPTLIWVLMLIVFYVKMLSLLVNMVPSQKPYRATDSESFFLIVLIIAFIMVMIPIFFVIFYMTPSRGCGPFSIYDYMFTIVADTIDTWPTWIHNTLDFIFGNSVIVPIIIILCLVIYYLSSMISALKDMLRLMKEQLSMEGADKQFLLKRIEDLQGGGKAKKKQSTIQEEEDLPNSIP